MEKKEFVTPPHHVNFQAKNLFGECGEIVSGAIAYLAPQGGGPVEMHTHPNDHLFIVVRGEARVELENEIRVIPENSSMVVPGHTLHSVWNNTDGETVMIGITLKR